MLSEFVQDYVNGDESIVRQSPRVDSLGSTAPVAWHIRGHWSKMANCGETRGGVAQDYHRLYKDAKEARYEGGEYTPLDLAPIEKRYLSIRAAMRKALSLSPAS